MLSFLKNKPQSLEIITVDEFIEECCTSIEPLFDARRILLGRRVEGGEHVLAVQREQLRSGILALLENAMQASAANQVVELKAVAASSRLTITIEDEGPGIANDILPRIFEPFATGKSQGTGLGLAIAKSTGLTGQTVALYSKLFFQYSSRYDRRRFFTRRKPANCETSFDACGGRSVLEGSA
jgi:two-component system sensor histidine kinase FlrB